MMVHPTAIPAIAPEPREPSVAGAVVEAGLDWDVMDPEVPEETLAVAIGHDVDQSVGKLKASPNVIPSGAHDGEKLERSVEAQVTKSSGQLKVPDV